MRYLVLLLLLASCSSPLIDKTDNSTTTIHCEYWEHDRTMPALDFLEAGLDDNARYDMTYQDNDTIHFNYCTDLANSTDDDVIEPEYDGGTL